MAEAEAFASTTHRTRYLHCDSLLSLPSGDIPLYAIWHVFHKKAVSFDTSPPSLIVYDNQTTIHLATTSQVKDKIGLWTKKPLPAGPDLKLRLNTTLFLFERQKSNHSSFFDSIALADLESLYHRIVEACRGGLVRPSFTTDAFRSHIPRPKDPEHGLDLGEESVVRRNDDDGSTDFTSRMDVVEP